MSQNRLHKQNCNKAKCKTCIFGSTPLILSSRRINEIYRYLATFQASHVCHTTNLTCHGSLEFQAKIAHAIGLIKQPTVNEFLNTANQFLNNEHTQQNKDN